MLFSIALSFNRYDIKLMLWQHCIYQYVLYHVWLLLITARTTWFRSAVPLNNNGIVDPMTRKTYRGYEEQKRAQVLARGERIGKWPEFSEYTNRYLLRAKTCYWNGHGATWQRDMLGWFIGYFAFDVVVIYYCHILIKDYEETNKWVSCNGTK